MSKDERSLRRAGEAITAAVLRDARERDLEPLDVQAGRSLRQRP